jgi:23S rRNA pseudouridine2457 synthase
VKGCLILINKPCNVLCQFTDSEGRATLADYVPVPDLYPAGRLDYDSEGLVLLTNVGWLQHQIAHPRFKLQKTYWVQVEGIPGAQSLKQLARGVLVKGERTHPAQVKLIEPPAVWPRHPPIRERKNIPTAWLEIMIAEGRKRQVRHMTAAVGHPTLRLIRWAIGPWQLGELQPGQWREVAIPHDLQGFNGK